MRGVALLLLCIFGSCGSSYEHSAFLCDAQHGCPSGQSCLAGRCRLGPPRGTTGLVCGAQTCSVPDEQCCLDSLQCVAAGIACEGPSALCDGVDDCPENARCCVDGNTLTCARECAQHACRGENDCPPDLPHCCDATPSDPGRCSRSC